MYVVPQRGKLREAGLMNCGPPKLVPCCWKERCKASKISDTSCLDYNSPPGKNFKELGVLTECYYTPPNGFSRTSLFLEDCGRNQEEMGHRGVFPEAALCH